MKDCVRCRLSEGRIQVVPGDGDPHAAIVFVGEAPGQREDEQGLPFVGAAGQLLDDLLEYIGIKRSDVYITNIIKCRPPNNREPQADEIAACHDWLVAQIATIKPKVVCPLGRPAAQTLIDPKISLADVKAKPLRKHGLLFVPLYHPAAALHRAPLRQTLFEDMLVLRRVLDEHLPAQHS